MMNRFAEIALALPAFMAGLNSARLWHQASRVQIIPMWEVNGRLEPVGIEHANSEWIVAMLNSAQKSGAINQLAAKWTAFTIFLGTAANLIGQF